MSNYSENELIPHALKIIKEHDDGIDMKDLIIRLRGLMNPDGIDCVLLANRSDDKFSQKVRNLKSHKTLEKKNLAEYKAGKFYINQEGLNFLSDLKNNINILSKKFNKTREGSNFIGIENQNDNPKSNTEKTENYDFLFINILRDWPITIRTYNALKRENIIFVGDLIAYADSSGSFSKLLRLKNFGRKSLVEIVKLYQKFVNDKIINFNLSKWEDLREKLIFDHKKKLIEKIESQKNLAGFNKSLFKNFEEFKEFFYKVEKIIINPNIEVSELEKLILIDIDHIQSLFTNRTVDFFKGRYGYKEKYKTLEQLGKKYEITRERVRQLERNLNSTLVRLGKIDKNSLVRFFEKYEYVSFHKLFPTLNKNFTDTARGTGEITRDKLVVFMENFCGVKEGYFKTPERELWHFDIEKLNDIFLLVPSGASSDDFLEKIKDFYGYDNFVAKSALEFMINKNYIRSVNNKVFPLKMSKFIEVAHILIDYPKGLHWKKICDIGNNSYTNNKWNTNRIVADQSINMICNKFIYLCERGTYKLFKYCSENKAIDLIIDEFIDYLKTNDLDKSQMKTAFKEITKKKQFQKLNFYDARAIIKKFGNEKGLYHRGTSTTDTIGFNKKLLNITVLDTIKNIFKNFHGEITLEDINQELQKIGFITDIEIHLNKLVNQTFIFKLNPGTYIKYEDGIKLCDKQEVSKLLDKLLSDYLFITRSFIREKINKELGYSYSSFYYDTLLKVIAKENKWHHSVNYLSKKSEKTKNFEDYIKENYNENLSTNENFEIISKKIGMTKINFNNVIYYSNMIFNTDWVHQND